MIGLIIGYLKKLRSQLRFKKVKQFIQYRNSHFFEQFNLNIAKPIAGKTYLTVGDDSLLACQVIFETDRGEVQIGNNVFIGASQLICRSGIIIEDYVFIAWGCYLYDHNSHSIDYRERQKDIEQQIIDYRAGVNFIENKNWDVVSSAPIKICANAWIGMNCIILKGVTIGQGAVVAAGSVVTKDVAPWTIVGGNPAQVIKQLPEELIKK